MEYRVRVKLIQGYHDIGNDEANLHHNKSSASNASSSCELPTSM